MHTLVSQVNESTEALYEARRNKLVAAGIKRYNKIIDKGIYTMTMMIVNKSTLISKLGRNDYQNRFLEVYNDTKKCIGWCIDLYTAKNDKNAIAQY